MQTKFVAFGSPESPNAASIYDSILKSLLEVGISKEKITSRLVGFCCDGANVMVGKKCGVSALLKGLQPSVVVVHCFAHRLQLSLKDAIKQNKLYESVLVLLMGLYYPYHNSP